MMHRKISFIITFILCATAFFAQNDSGVFAPFVSRVTASPEANRVILSWKNPEDASGFKQIFRDDAEITEKSIGEATMIARVAPDAESYIDTPPDNRQYYYAVLLEDKGGDLFRVFIPYRNKTIAAVRTEALSADSLAASITGINALVAGDSVTIRFVPSNKTRDLILYRSIAPLRSFTDLTKASYSLLLSGGTDQVKDVPLAGINYYYAVIDAKLLNSGKADFIPGQNATVVPVQIPLTGVTSVSNTSSERVYPLPAPHILYSIETGDELLPPLPFLLPREMKLAAVLQNRVDHLIDRIQRPATSPAFDILPVDQAANLEGEDLLLQSLAKSAAAAPDSKESIDSLVNFLQTQHSDQVEARGRFYLGQSYFLHGQYRDALREFVFARDLYYIESQKWLDACLQALHFLDG
jgi:hypothetical protein